MKTCEHNTMTRTGDAAFPWKCAACGYIYGHDDLGAVMSTLRAENERLRDKIYTLKMGHQRDVQKKRIRMIQSQSLLDALINLTVFVNGKLGQNPYTVPEFKAACIAVCHATGHPTENQQWMDGVNAALAERGQP